MPVHADKNEAGNTNEDTADGKADAVNRDCCKRENEDGQEMEAIKKSIFVLFIYGKYFRISLPQKGS